MTTRELDTIIFEAIDQAEQHPGWTQIPGVDVGLLALYRTVHRAPVRVRAVHIGGYYPFDAS